ncbi:MAG: hypothetical protein II727_05345, partial [Oscillospiraceae bacterium]|nr:hypothetical protein [Oscillospiraceae bacterium]
QDLTQLIGHGFVRRNLSTAHFPYRGQFPDLQGAMPAILIEMCVFSMPGVVEFLPALPDYFKSGSLDGIWLYTWAKLETLSWDEKGARAVLVSDRDQTLTLRMRKPCTMKIGGKAVAMDGDHVDYAFKKGEKTQIEIVF